MQQPTRRFEKAISYDPATRDFTLSLDGEIVGYARTYADGERTLNELVYSILTHQQPEPPCPTCGSDGSACVDCTPADDRAALRGEVAHAAERERLRLMLEELAAERPNVGAYGRAIEAMEDGAEWWRERGALVVQRVRGSRHVIGAAGCECLAGQHGRQCWASGLATALERLERRRMAA